ncbi:MAG: carbohydrate binding domain-containing protein [Pirellulales bacterium]|nr:carbohydrate binding domain-containing protein [Pirellulales bacterium]
MSSRIFFALFFVTLSTTGVFGAEIQNKNNEAGMFPFVISYDAPENATNVSCWMHRPAGKYGFVRAEDGHLVTDKGPIRFWATNLCFGACFPSSEQAEHMAARMARLGINCVRMHHMDSYSIWGDSPNRTIIDPKQLAKLDYLIYKLKQHGIYTNINLHVSRWLGEKEGFPGQAGRPKYDKGLDNFEPRMIELQKKYAKDLLTHVNPHTNTAYLNEPAVAMVEINNENALTSSWAWNKLDELPQPYIATFRKLWNKWLCDKYGTTEKLAKAWNSERIPLGNEMLKNGDFSQGKMPPWVLETDSQCKIESSLQSGKVGDGAARKSFLRFVVTQTGSVAWRPQLIYSGFPLKADTQYTLTFKMRSDTKHRIDIGCKMAHEPWENLGFFNRIEVTPEWKDYHFAFTATQDESNARINFNKFVPGTYEITDVSLRSGGTVGLQPNEKLENDTVSVLRHGQLCSTPAARRDFIDFIWELEDKYWLGMYRFLKDDLGLRSVVSGTQRGYGPVFPQAKLDYIDSHAYWKHPDFPGRPWDPGNWTMHNVPMVNEPAGTLERLAGGRVWRMPYTISEYNHPTPNQYAAEGFPMIAAVGRFQDWDGIFSFAYSHQTNATPRRTEGFFDIRSNTVQLAHMPACAAMFLRGDVQPARKTFLTKISPHMERESLYKKLNGWSLDTAHFGLDRLTPLVHGVAMQLVKEGKGGKIDSVEAGGKTVEKVKPPEFPQTQKIFISDNGQLRWDLSLDNAGFFTVDTPRTKVFTGFRRQNTFILGNVSLNVKKTRLNWATVSMVCIDGEGFDRPGRILISATGLMQNHGAKLRKIGDDRVTYGRNWGSEPVMCEGVTAEITLPAAAERVRTYPLDESGNRRDEMEVGSDNGQAKIILGPKYKTVWYEVVIR